MSKLLRKLLRLLGRLACALVIIGLVALATLPWWMEPVLRQVLAKYGYSFAHYERVGYSRFALSQLAVGGSNWNVAIDRIEADTPLLWCWHRWQKQSAGITAGKWRLEIHPPAPDKTLQTESGWVPLRDQLLSIGKQLTKWVPTLHTAEGQINWSDSQIALASLDWQDSVLGVRELSFRDWRGDLELTMPKHDSGAMSLHLAVPNQQGSLQLVSDSSELRGDVQFWQQSAKVSADFDATGWKPKSAHLVADHWTVPGDALKVGSRYRQVHGSGQLDWKDSRFTGDLSIEGEPLPDQPADPFKALLHATGDVTEIAINLVDITTPGLTAHLSKPIRIGRNGVIDAADARFTVQVDLTAPLWGFDRGRLEGEAHAKSGLSASPEIFFSLTGTDVTRGDIQIQKIAANATLTWPLLRITDATLAFSPDEQSTLKAEIDLAQRQIISAETSGIISAVRLRPGIALPFECAPIHFTATANGALKNPAHHGTVSVASLHFAPFKPFALTAEWNGTGPNFSTVKLQASATGSTLLASGSLQGSDVTLESLNWTHDHTELLRLTEPVTFATQPIFAGGPLRLSGVLGELQLHLKEGRLTDGQTNLHDFPSSLLADFIDLPGPSWTLRQLQTTWSIVDATRKFSLRGEGLINDATTGESRVTIAAHSAEGGIQLEQFEVANAAGQVAHAAGFLPVDFHPANTPLWSIHQTGPVTLDLRAQPTGPLLTLLNQSTGLNWISPSLSAKVSGTWENMDGMVQFELAHLERTAPQTAASILTLDNTSVSLHVNRAGLILDKFSSLLGGQPMSASGRLPWPSGGWHDLIRDPVTAAKQGLELDLQLPETDLKAWGRDLTAAFITGGRVQAQLKLRPGTGSTGWVRLTQTTTRPIGPLGAIHELSAELQVAGDTLVLAGADGLIGGQPIHVSGRLIEPLSGKLRGELALTGTHVPLVRQRGLLVRADFDFKINADRVTPPVITGRLQLRDSLLLVDLRDFIGNGTSSSTRAPYFSVKEPPFSDWTLAVQVTGNRFLRIRSPVFNGVASAYFKFSGTLGDPRAIGEAVVDEGFVIFPYATFRVQYGRAELSPAHEFDPQLSFKGTSRSLGYDLRMEIKGSVSTPQISFSSSPALKSEEALLLVLAGEAPRDEITYSTMQRATRIGSYLGQRLFAGLNSTPDRGPTLHLASGEKLSQQGRQTYQLEYMLDDRWSLLGDYDEFDQYNADLKWKLPFFTPNPSHADK